MPVLFFLLQGSSSGPASMFGGFLPIIAMVAIFYFLVFMPMRKQQKRQKEMVASLQNGQTVLTSGGIIGTIVAVDGDTLVLRIKPDNLKLQVARSAVNSVLGPDDQAVKK
jgi:preprotein translocase subunit YajC